MTNYFAVQNADGDFIDARKTNRHYAYAIVCDGNRVMNWCGRQELTTRALKTAQARSTDWQSTQSQDYKEFWSSARVHPVVAIDATAYNAIKADLRN